MAAGVVSFIAHYLTLYSCYASIIAYLARFFCLSPASFLGNSTNYNLNLSATSIPELNIPTPSGPFNSNYGYGLVNANAAVSSTLNRSNPFPAIPDFGGTNWALDVINAPEVWHQNITGNGIVVAVVDTGVDYTHPDLDDNIWRNAGEIAGNGIDDDRNGYIDDIRGWDFVASDNNPMDLDFDGHGTHIAGAIAAERNNFGITGVAPNAKIMPVRVLSAFGSGIRIMLLLESAMLLIMEPM
jgi:subtilisin family serine protease